MNGVCLEMKAVSFGMHGDCSNTCAHVTMFGLVITQSCNIILTSLLGARRSSHRLDAPSQYVMS